MLSLQRNKGVPKGNALYFGPYTSADSARQTFELLLRLFPLRRCSDRELSSRERPCLLYQMKKCVAPCVGYISKEDYQVHVQRVIQFLKGKDQELIKEFKQLMQKASDALAFEDAQHWLQLIRAIEKTVERQKVHILKAEDHDVWGFYREGPDLMLSLLTIRQGKVLRMDHYPFSKVLQEDEDVLSSFLLQHYLGHLSEVTSLLLPLEIESLASIAELLSTEHKRKVRCVFPKKGEKKELIEMANVNAKAAFQRRAEQENSIGQSLMELKERLHLSHYPERIECFDISHTSGGDAVGVMVVYKEGRPEKSLYRKYILKESKAGDDYGAMKEVLSRRYKRAKNEDDFPSLIVIDGGKGQLSIAKDILEELDCSIVDLIALTKEEGRHDKGMTSERVFLPERKEAISLPKRSRSLHLLQNIRDEAHRFAITFQQKKQRKRVIRSVLDEVPGIGPKKKKVLLKHFGSIKAIQSASDEEILSVKGISQTDLTQLRKHL